MNDNKDKYRPRLTSLTRLMLTDRLLYLIVVFLTMCFLGKRTVMVRSEGLDLLPIFRSGSACKNPHHLVQILLRLYCRFYYNQDRDCGPSAVVGFVVPQQSKNPVLL